MHVHSHNFRADEWLLYYLQSPRASDGRGTAFGMLFTEAGELVVTVVQEGVLRLRRSAPAPASL